MKQLSSIFSAALLVILFSGSADAQTQPVGPKTVKGTELGPNWVDTDGDGICDNQGSGVKNGQRNMNGKGYGPKDGTGNHGVRPQDGTGYGAKNGAGSGQCDGTGPKGSRMNKGGGNGSGYSSK